MARGHTELPEDVWERTDVDWRTIASWWHGGQFTPLYAFTSTGTIVDGLVEEIESCLKTAAPDDAIELEALLDHVRERAELADEDPELNLNSDWRRG